MIVNNEEIQFVKEEILNYLHQKIQPYIGYDYHKKILDYASEFEEKFKVSLDKSKELINAYYDMIIDEWAKDKVYASWINNTTGSIDYGNDIKKAINDVNRSTRRFNFVFDKIIDIITVNKHYEYFNNTSLNQITYEKLEEMYEYGIDGDKIQNPILKIMYEKHIKIFNNNVVLKQFEDFLESSKLHVLNCEKMYEKYLKEYNKTLEKVALKYDYVLLNIIRLCQHLEIPSIVEEYSYNELLKRYAKADQSVLYCLTLSCEDYYSKSFKIDHMSYCKTYKIVKNIFDKINDKVEILLGLKSKKGEYENLYFNAIQIDYPKWNEIDLNAVIKKDDINGMIQEIDNGSDKNFTSDEKDLVLTLRKSGYDIEQITSFIKVYRSYNCNETKQIYKINQLKQQIDALKQFGLERESKFNQLKKSIIDNMKNTKNHPEFQKAIEQLKKILNNRGYFEKKNFDREGFYQSLIHDEQYEKDIQDYIDNVECEMIDCSTYFQQLENQVSNLGVSQENIGNNINEIMVKVKVLKK